MINKNKSNKNQLTAQVVAGLLPNDSGIEFVGVHENKTILWLQHGCTREFKDLSGSNYITLWQYYDKDQGAKAFLNQPNIPLNRQVELYIYYMCGAVDATPDLVDGILNFSENFRTSESCPSLHFDNKQITIGDVVLSSREIRMIDLMKQDLPDKTIASELQNRNGSKGISVPTFDFHKKNLLQKTNMHTRTGLVQAAINEGI